VNRGGQLSIELEDDRLTVAIQRDAGVNDQHWLELQSEFGSYGQGAVGLIRVSLPEFISRRQSVSSLARRAGAGVIAGDHLKSVLLQLRGDQEELNRLIEEGPPPADLEPRGVLILGSEESRFCRDLRDFQSDNLATLVQLDHGANFSVPGAGKTAVTLALYESERVSGRVKRLLVVAPLSAFSSWVTESDESFTERPKIQEYDGASISWDTEILLLNYHRLSNAFDVVADWVSAEPTMCVLDEAHRMKAGWEGMFGAACLKLAYMAKRRDVLSGTPAPQSFRDLESIFSYLWPGSARRLFPSQLSDSDPTSAKKVNKSIRPLFVRTTKKDLGLPKLTRSSVVVPLEGLQRDIYLALKGQYRGFYQMSKQVGRDFRRMGRIYIYLLEAATNPKLLTHHAALDGTGDIFYPAGSSPDSSEGAHSLDLLLAQYNQREIPGKFRALLTILDQNVAAGRKTLVWSYFVRNLELLLGQLARLSPAIAHGGIPTQASSVQSSRNEQIERFINDPDCWVLLANPAAIGEGVSLHSTCHDAVYLERTFNAGQYLQSIDRIHRLGLSEDQETRITYLLTDETIDLAVKDRIGSKIARLETMLADPEIEVGALAEDEEEALVPNDSEDFNALVSHLMGNGPGTLSGG
jgi:SNF2 family DNA or RNA helicase